MSDYTNTELEAGRAIVRGWSESEGRGLALSILIARALASARSEASGGWIPCEERMPEPTDADDPGRFVLVVRVSHGERDVCKTWWSPGAKYPFEMYRVTHWRETPRPPRSSP